MGKENVTDLASITHEWKEGWPGFRRTVRVCAQQVEMPPEYGGMCATAQVLIYVNDKLVHQADVPWPMPKGLVILPLQVYMLAIEPDSSHSEWQRIMEKFARKCDGFEVPTKMFWTKEPLLD